MIKGHGGIDISRRFPSHECRGIAGSRHTNGKA